MTTLELSVFEDHGVETIAVLHKMVAQFEKDERIKVNLTLLPWRGGWEKMVNVALYGDGYDVSSIGSTWVGDFVKMDALSLFTSAELRLLGSEKDYLPASWSSGVTRMPDGGSMVWAIPWYADTRSIYYRRDLLKRAGVDETTAFQSLDQFEKTLEKLIKSGVEVPLTLPMDRSRQNVHNLASFVWGAGGEFLTSGGQQIAFDTPEALAGMKKFFDLMHYVVPQVRHFGERDSDDFFSNGHAAVTISGTWLPQRTPSPTVRNQLGAAVLPGVPWVGGSNLVIWKNCLSKREAVRLIQYLTRGPLSEQIFPEIGFPFPARLSMLEAPRYLSDPLLKVMRQSLLAGRAFPTEQLWGLIETRLTDLLPLIWGKMFAEPETPIETILAQFIPGLARRLSMTLDVRR